MAQHIPIECFKQKKFRTIEQGIRKAFSGHKARYMRGSLRYIWEKSISEHAREHKDIDVFHTERNIGEGFVWGTNRGCFEIHFNIKTNKIEHIFLVA